MVEAMKEVSKTLDFLIEENRRKTFKKWVFSDNEICNVNKMAEAGFIFTESEEEPDSVMCFLCNKSLDGWEPTDDPWQEHLKHSPNCYFAQLQKPQDMCTLNQIILMKDILSKNIMKPICNAKIREMEQKFNEYEEKILAELEKFKS